MPDKEPAPPFRGPWPRLELSRLEGFYWVAKTGGYSRAARAFPYPITQPAVHQQVRKLEAGLGAALFARAGRDQMRLTAAGRSLYDVVAPFLESLPGVERAIRRGSAGGTLTIHAAALILRDLMPAWIRRLRRARPDIHVELHEAERPEPGLLTAGRTDLLVDYLPDLPAHLEARPVAAVRPFVALPASHPLASRKRWSLEALREETFVFYNPDLPAHRLQAGLLSRHGIAPERSLAASTAETILAFVEAGLGWSLVPSLSEAGPRTPGVASRPLPFPRHGFPVVAAWRPSGSPDPLIQAALEAAPRPE